MKLRAPYTFTLYHSGTSDAVWIWNGGAIVALLSPANAVRFYGELKVDVFS